MLADEIHHWLGIVQTVGMMPDARLVDHHDLTTQFLVALLDDGGIFRRRHHLIGITNHI